ncbi:hypothetical protein [Haloferula sargassicola]|uniref:Uncharacterized protein n=1 Tax=Haloferula sargassicola TaxID=490096 RepID=A0ABP9UPQ0_9BACT
MGLDMYLTGQVGVWSFKHQEEVELRDGFRVKCRELDLGYWRKHPNLHGFIIEEFARGEDRCQQVYLEAEDMRTVILAIEQNRLPFTEGFFFGQSQNDEDEKRGAIETFTKAIEWLEDSTDEAEWKCVYYQASW